MLSHLAFLPAIVALAAAAPTATLQERSTQICAQYATVQTADFTVFNNLWGEGGATGSQCTTVDSANGDSIVWSTAWSWSGGSGVKSYANAGLHFASTQLSKISSINTSWQWRYSGNNLVGDVSYDTFLSDSAGGSAVYEVMVWLWQFGGAGPISSTYGSNGATPVASATIGGTNWDLYKGPNGDTTVFSFLPANGDALTNFNGNLKDFYDYLVSNQGVSDSLYLTTLQAGTEPTSGSDATFTVSSYTIDFDA